MADTPIIIETWQLFTGIAIFIISILSAAIAIIRYYLKLRNDVDNLQKDLDRFKEEYNEHPIMSMFKQWVKKDGVFYFLNDSLLISIYF